MDIKKSHGGKKPCRVQGFTMIEVIISIIIISIVAVIGLPRIQKTIDRTRERNAAAQLELIRSSEEVYRNRTKPKHYLDVAVTTNCSVTNFIDPEGCIEDLNRELGLEIMLDGMEYDYNSVSPDYWAYVRYRKPGLKGYFMLRVSSDCEDICCNAGACPTIESCATLCP